MNGSSIGAYLKKLRIQNGLSRAKAAKLARVSATRLYELEIGVSSTTRRPTAPSREQLARLAKAYGVTSEELLEKAGYLIKANGLPPDIERLIDLYQRLPLKTRQLLFDVLDEMVGNQVAQ